MSPALPEAPSAQSDDERLRELTLYIAKKSLSDRRFGAVKLNKLLFFADLAAYRRLGRTITGATYQRLPEGPAPRRILPVIQAMEDEGAAFVLELEFHGYPQHKLIARKLPDLSGFSGPEIATVDEILDEFRDSTARQITEDSHDYIGWRLAKDGEDVPFEPALLGKRPITEQDLRIAETIEAELEHAAAP